MTAALLGGGGVGKGHMLGDGVVVTDIQKVSL